MGGGHEQLLGSSTITHASAYVEGDETTGSFRLLFWLECRCFGHDVSRQLNLLRLYTNSKFRFLWMPET